MVGWTSLCRLAHLVVGLNRLGAKGSQITKGRHLSSVFSGGGVQPLVRFQSSRSVAEVFVLAVSPGVLFSGCMVRVCFGSIARCFSSDLG